MESLILSGFHSAAPDLLWITCVALGYWAVFPKLPITPVRSPSPRNFAHPGTLSPIRDLTYAPFPWGLMLPWPWHTSGKSSWGNFIPQITFFSLILPASYSKSSHITLAEYFMLALWSDACLSFLSYIPPILTYTLHSCKMQPPANPWMIMLFDHCMP